MTASIFPHDLSLLYILYALPDTVSFFSIVAVVLVTNAEYRINDVMQFEIFLS